MCVRVRVLLTFFASITRCGPTRFRIILDLLPIYPSSTVLGSNRLFFRINPPQAREGVDPSVICSRQLLQVDFL